MAESSCRRRRASKAFKDHLVLNSRISKFGRCVLALWPDKPALNLAQRVGTTERNANRIIRGERKVTLRATLAVVGEWK